MTNLNQHIVAAALVVIALVLVADFTVGALNRQRAIDNAYAVGYSDGESDGFDDGLHAVYVDDHATDCHCDSCVESGRYDKYNNVKVNPFK